MRRLSSVLIVSIGLILSACQTHQEKIATQHFESIQKWKALAKYARNSLDEYGIIVTTQPSLSQGRFVLTNFAFSKSESLTKINLLNPRFEHKYICSPICSQLNEYVAISEARGNTLLNEYFKHHEIDLFHLYGDLFHLNKRLENLKALNSEGLNAFLNYTAQQGLSFSSPKSFSKFLQRQLSDDAYTRFLERPESADQHIQASNTEAHWYIQHQRYDGNLELAKWDAAEASATENSHWVQTSEDDRFWATGTTTHEHHWETLKTRSVVHADATIQASWREAALREVSVNDSVCSFQDNLFGVVDTIDKNFATVLLGGQAKLVSDGVILDVKAGALFSGDQELSFLPLDRYQTLKLSEIVVCDIN